MFVTSHNELVMESSLLLKVRTQLSGNLEYGLSAFPLARQVNSLLCSHYPFPCSWWDI